MKTKVSIELTDPQRSVIAELIDGEPSKRMVTRKEVVQLCQEFVQFLTEFEPQAEPEPLPEPQGGCKLQPPSRTRIDPADKRLLKGKPESYIRGWYQVKTKMRNK